MIFSLFILVGVSYNLYTHIVTRHTEFLRRELKSLAAITAIQLPGDILEELTTPEQEASSDYIRLKQLLATIADQSSQLKYIYTLRKTEKPGIYQFIVDGDPDPASAAHIGELYDGRHVPALEDAFLAPSADSEFFTDQWGTTLSGYAPVFNSRGETVAIVGLDMTMDYFLADLKIFRDKFLYIATAASILAFLISLALTHAFAKRMLELENAAEQIACGQNVIHLTTGNDEVSPLALKLQHLAIALNNERETILLSAVEALLTALEAKDPYTSGHSSEVASLSVQIACKLQLSSQEIFKIRLAALLHDIGKIGIPDSVLNKAGPLTQEEWKLIKQHPAIGAKIIAGIPALADLALAVSCHHCRFDGTGYPATAGEQIPLAARIIAVADSFQAMTADRPYRRGLAPEEALAEIKRCAGTQFDPAIADIFIMLQKKNPISFAKKG
ncbi:MAG: HD-GYP domain-containing protein [Negativicutes bacterium]|nr:HD-GYP domain-containing protein [Negativicutes bacterium]